MSGPGIGGYALVIVLIGIVIFVLLFLLFREIMCWYYKINTMLNEQRKMNALLQQLLDAQRQTYRMLAAQYQPKPTQQPQPTQQPMLYDSPQGV